MARKYYQSEWFGIYFNEFINEDSKNLADSFFYDKFYEKLFSKYNSYKDLPKDWKEQKFYISEWLRETLLNKKNILSFGTGIGYIEHLLLKKYPDQNLEIFDFSSRASKWIKKENPKILSLQNLNSIRNKYDAIYLCSVDCSIKNKDLISLLIKLKTYLNKEGRLIIISSSYINEPKLKFLIRIKEFIKLFLEIMRIKHRGQLWGYLRTRKEYKKIFDIVGFSKVKDGFIECKNEEIYFIFGTS